MISNFLLRTGGKEPRTANGTEMRGKKQEHLVFVRFYVGFWTNIRWILILVCEIARANSFTHMLAVYDCVTFHFIWNISEWCCVRWMMPVRSHLFLSDSVSFFCLFQQTIEEPSLDHSCKSSCLHLHYQTFRVGHSFGDYPKMDGNFTIPYKQHKCLYIANQNDERIKSRL